MTKRNSLIPCRVIRITFALLAMTIFSPYVFAEEAGAIDSFDGFMNSVQSNRDTPMGGDTAGSFESFMETLASDSSTLSAPSEVVNNPSTVVEEVSKQDIAATSMPTEPAENFTVVEETTTEDMASPKSMAQITPETKAVSTLPTEPAPLESFDSLMEDVAMNGADFNAGSIVMAAPPANHVVKRAADDTHLTVAPSVNQRLAVRERHLRNQLSNEQTVQEAEYQELLQSLMVKLRLLEKEKESLRAALKHSNRVILP